MRIHGWMALTFCVLLVARWAGAETEGAGLRMDAALKAARSAQERAEAFMRDEEKLGRELFALETESEALRYENHMLEKRIRRQEARLETLSAEGERAVRLIREVEPLLGDLSAFLENRMDGLPPFRLAERRERIKGLALALEDGELDTPARLDRALDLLEAELNLGLFPDTAAAAVEVGGESLQGTLLHLGAAGLFFLSPDRGLVARWSPVKAAFVPLERPSAQAVERAFSMVERRLPAGLVWLPLPEDF